MLKITLKDGSSLEVEKGLSILDVAKIISEGLAEFNKLSDGFAFQIRKKLSKIRR